MASNQTDTNSSRVLYLPTQKSCRDYGYARTPEKYNGRQDDILPDFLSGPQFEKTNYMSSLRNNEIPTEVDSNVMDEVIIEVLKNNPYASITDSTPITVNGVSQYRETYEGNVEQAIYTIRIAPEWESIDMNVKHNWDSPDSLLSNIIGGVSDIYGVVDEVLTSIRNIDSSSNNSNNRVYYPKLVQKVDIRQQYHSTDKETIKIPFVLFTKDDFVKDVFYPITFLTALSYPTKVDFTSIVDRVTERFTESATSTLTTDDNRDTISNLVNSVLSGINVDVSLPPPYLRVRHASNLFNYSHMVIQSFSYTFSKAQYNIKDDFTMQERSFPIYANCELTLKAQDVHLSDHYLFMIDEMKRFSNNSKEVININLLNTNTGTEPEIGEERIRLLEIQQAQSEFRRDAISQFEDSEQTNPHLFCKEYGQNNSTPYLYSGYAQRDCERALFDSDKENYCNHINDGGVQITSDIDSCVDADSPFSILANDNGINNPRQYSDGREFFSDAGGPIQRNPDGTSTAYTDSQIEQRDRQ